MTENEILERKVKALEELVEIQRQTIDALKALPLNTFQIPLLPQPVQQPLPQWGAPFNPWMPPYTITCEGVRTFSGATGGGGGTTYTGGQSYAVIGSAGCSSH